MTAVQLETALETNATSAHVRLRGELDLAGIEAAERALAAAESSNRGVVLLDLSGLRFIDSSGLRFILRADRRSRDNGGRLRLVPGPPEVQRVFRLTGIEERLPFQAA